MKKIKVIGGGLAGPEAALQAAAAGCTVELYEMRPHRSTEAHETADFAELVCSNSLKSESEYSAPWLLKQEMRRAAIRAASGPARPPPITRIRLGPCTLNGPAPMPSPKPPGNECPRRSRA